MESNEQQILNDFTEMKQKRHHRIHPQHRKRPRRREQKIFLAASLPFFLVLLISSCLIASHAASTKTTSSSNNETNTTEVIVDPFGENQTQQTALPDNYITAEHDTPGSGGDEQRSTDALLQKKAPETFSTPSTRTSRNDARLEDELQEHARQLEAQQKDKEMQINQQQEQTHKEFMDWCQKVLGVQTSLEVHTFYYYDYMTALTTHPQNNIIVGDDDDDFERDEDAGDVTLEEEEKKKVAWQDPPLIPVRGLRATRDISEGETVISIPFQALLTVSTTIDQDPVLSRVMGPKARKAYGWTLGQDESISKEDVKSNNEPPSVDFFELPLLAMALLHHRKLGSSSPLFPYINLLQNSPIDSMPYLWNKKQRREFHAYQSRISQGVETVARSIRQEMKDMYHTVVETLVTNHPDLFGKDTTGARTQYDVLEEEEWAFSFEKFQWAFAMVNSRHWLLPISDLETKPSKPPSPSKKQQEQPQGSVDGVPPAQMPTDAWLDQSGEDDDDDDSTQQQRRGQQENVNGKASTTSSYHSFLAPVADLLNFGPPCTRGSYNHETHTFDIIASCNFESGQEVTFWYADECEDIIIGNYGFTHPMVPKCPTAEEYREKMERWKRRATSLQEELEDAYEDMDVIDTELQNVQRILADCDCCETESVPAAYWMQHRQQINSGQQQNQRRPEEQGGEGLHANYLRNPQEKTSRQIRGGTMISGSSSGSDGTGGERRRSDRRSTKDARTDRSRRSPRGSAANDDDVQNHGIRRMWAGRSGL